MTDRSCLTCGVLPPITDVFGACVMCKSARLYCSPVCRTQGFLRSLCICQISAELRGEAGMSTNTNERLTSYVQRIGSSRVSAHCSITVPPPPVDVDAMMNTDFHRLMSVIAAINYSVDIDNASSIGLELVSYDLPQYIIAAIDTPHKGCADCAWMLNNRETAPITCISVVLSHNGVERTSHMHVSASKVFDPKDKRVPNGYASYKQALRDHPALRVPRCAYRVTVTADGIVQVDV